MNRYLLENDIKINNVHKIHHNIYTILIVSFINFLAIDLRLFGPFLSQDCFCQHQQQQLNENEHNKAKHSKLVLWFKDLLTQVTTESHYLTLSCCLQTWNAQSSFSRLKLLNSLTFYYCRNNPTLSSTIYVWSIKLAASLTTLSRKSAKYWLIYNKWRSTWHVYQHNIIFNPWNQMGVSDF